MMKRLIALALALGMLAGFASAEGITDFSAMLPLIDLSISAALRTGETPAAITADDALDAAFAENFFLLGRKIPAPLGITEAMLSDPQAQQEYLARAFAASAPEMKPISAAQEVFSYIGLKPTASSMDGDRLVLYGDVYQAEKPMALMSEEEALRAQELGWRAVAEVRRDDAAPGGWKLYGLTFEPALKLENAFTPDDAMVEYYSTELGFYLQYPAVFTEDTIREEGSGVAGELKDGNASFFARRIANTSADSIDTYAQKLAGRYEGADVVLDEASLSAQVIHKREDGTIQVDMIIVSDRWIYEAQLCYAPGVAEDFALYSEYMKNSFTADELGLG